MSRFSKEDFNPENAQRLNVIVMKQMGKHPLTAFQSLGEALKKKFNRLLNEYIQSLGEDWKETLIRDFDTIVNEDILTEEFDPSKVYIPDCRTERNLLITEDQMEFLEQRRVELGEETIKV